MRMFAHLGCALTCCGLVHAADTFVSGLGIGSTNNHDAADIVTEFWDYPADLGKRGLVTGGFWSKSSGPLDPKHLPDPSAKAGSRKNIFWRTTLPNWGNNAPLKVQDKIYVLCAEGYTTTAPQLVCIDDKDGSILWQQLVDHLDAPGVPAEAKVARDMEIKRYEEWMYWWNRCYFSNEQYDWARHTPESYAPLRAEANAAGWNMSPQHKWPEKGNSSTRNRMGLGVNKQGGGGSGGTAKDPKLNANHKKVMEQGWHHYQDWGTEAPWYGSTHGSLVSDGSTIYVVTGIGAVAAFDLAGKRKWMSFIQWHKRPVSKVTDGIRSLSSPALADDVLVHYHFDTGAVYGFDIKTGKQLWKTPFPMKDGKMERQGGHMGPASTPAIITVNGTKLAVMGHGMVVRVSDGTNLGWIPGGGRFYYSIVAQDDVVYLPTPHTELSHSVQAVRVKLDGDTLSHEVLWANTIKERGDGVRSDAANMILDGKRLYAGGKCYDTDTGKRLARGGGVGKYPTGNATSQRYIVQRTGDWKHRDFMTYGIIDKTTMQTVGRGFLGEPSPEPGSDIEKRHIAFLGFPDIAIGCTALSAWGDRIYIRSNDYLWCIGK